MDAAARRRGVDAGARRRPRSRGSGTRPAPATPTPTGRGSTTCGCRSAALRGYVEKLEAGEDIERPLERGPRGARRASPPSTASCSRATRTARRSTGSSSSRAPSIPTSRTTTSTSSTGTTRCSGTRSASSGDVFVAHGFLEDARGHLLPAPQRDPLRALRPYIGWATMTEARGPSYWPEIVAERRGILRGAARLDAAARARRAARGGDRAADGRCSGASRARRSTSGSAPARTATATLNGVAASPGVARGHGPRRHDCRGAASRRARRDPRLPRSPPRAGRPSSRRSPPRSPTSAGSWPTRRSCRREYGLPAVVGTGLRHAAHPDRPARSRWTATTAWCGSWRRPRYEHGAVRGLARRRGGRHLRARAGRQVREPRGDDRRRLRRAAGVRRDHRRVGGVRRPQRARRGAARRDGAGRRATTSRRSRRSARGSPGGSTPRRSRRRWRTRSAPRTGVWRSGPARRRRRSPCARAASRRTWRARASPASTTRSCG